MSNYQFETKTRKLIETYNIIKELLGILGYTLEKEWQNNLNINHFTEKDFLRESAWVILSTGMKETVIRKHFLNISQSFYFWESSSLISNNSEKCIKNAKTFFNNKAKLNAIIDVSNRIQKEGFESIRNKILKNDVEYLESFNYIGPTTALHLAKNLGFDVVKTDRHLIRIANTVNIGEPLKMCTEISKATGDKLSVVDLVLWRYATIEKNYIKEFIF